MAIKLTQVFYPKAPEMKGLPSTKLVSTILRGAGAGAGAGAGITELGTGTGTLIAG